MAPIGTAAGASLGHVQVSPDADGTVRRLPLVVQIGETPVPALSLQAAARLPAPAAGRTTRSMPGDLLFAGRPIPIDDFAQTRINYGGPPSHRPALLGAPTVPGVSYVDVLNGSFDPARRRRQDGLRGA